MSKLNLFDLNKYDDLKNDDNNNPVNPIVNSNVNHDVNPVNHSVNLVGKGEDGSKVSQPIDEGTDTVDCVPADTVDCVSNDTVNCVSADTVNCVSADDVAYALSDTRSDAVRIVNELAARHIDITETYKQWVSVAFALISEFGEQGREMFHMLSRQNSRYQYEESDRKFSSCLKSHGSGITIKTIFHLAKEAGVELANHENYLHEERRTGTTTTTSPTSPTGVVNNENIEKSSVLGCFNENVGVSDLSYLSYFPSELHLPVTGYTFSDKLPLEDLPAFLAPIYEVHDNSVDRDKMLLGALNIISGLMGGANGTADCHCGIYGLYDARRVYAPLYNIVYGAAGSSKGEIAFCKRIAAPVKQEMRRLYEYEKQQYEQQMAQYEAQGKGKAKADRGEAPKEPPYRDPSCRATAPRLPYTVPWTPTADGA
ncbi:PriCT-2 domain-containing protein [uncultured Prevotella sp.]|uniref:PriCT-2 domain-containing protein n=1 Tax=uncultured Prevotella sp. TaxID=159272 RepID=UPI00260DDDDC|nr:PriCT-2 domain-containing protein [uncultured Prevotella sp.]